MMQRFHCIPDEDQQNDSGSIVTSACMLALFLGSQLNTEEREKSLLFWSSVALAIACCTLLICCDDLYYRLRTLSTSS